MNINFDEDLHSYSIDGKKIPSVTQILKDVGLVDDRWFNESHAIRGSLVHEYSEKLDAGELNVFDIDESLIGYIRAYHLFKIQFSGTILKSETRVYHPERFYAGTFDRTVSQSGVNYLLDIKTGAKQTWHKLQLGAYWGAYPFIDKDTKLSNEGLILCLKDDGSYKLEVIDGMRQFANLFYSCASVYHLKNKALK